MKLFLILPLLLAGCATAPVATASRCPVVHDYTPAEQKALSAALAPIAPDSPIIELAHNYDVLAKEAHACQE